MIIHARLHKSFFPGYSLDNVYEGYESSTAAEGAALNVIAKRRANVCTIPHPTKCVRSYWSKLHSFLLDITVPLSPITL